MTNVVVDTDVSFIFKNHPIGALYEAGWAIHSKWGPGHGIRQNISLAPSITYLRTIDATHLPRAIQG